MYSIALRRFLTGIMIIGLVLGISFTPAMALPTAANGASALPPATAKTAKYLGFGFSGWELSNNRALVGSEIEFRAEVLKRYDDGSTVKAPKGTKATLQFKARGSSAWADKKTVATNADGWVDDVATVTADGYWRLVAADGTATKEKYVDSLTAPSVAFTVSSKEITWNDPVTFRATLKATDDMRTRVSLKNGEAYPTLQFRVDSKSKWEDVEYLETDGNGRAVVKLYPQASGDWQIAVPGKASTPISIKVDPLDEIQVDWPSEFTDSLQVYAIGYRNYEEKPMKFELSYRPNKYSSWTKVGQASSVGKGWASIVSADYGTGYYKVCAPSIGACSYENYS
jgi:hypothetical protein